MKHINSLVLLLVLLLIIGGLLSSAVRADEKTYAYPDDLLALICKTIVLEAHEAVGVKAKFEKLPSKRALIMTNAGDYDGEACRIRDVERTYPNLVRVEPSISSLDGYVYTKNIEFPITGWDSIKSYNIGIHRGHQFSLNGTKGMKHVQIVRSDSQLLKMLNSGRIDVAVMIETGALGALRSGKLEGKIKKLSPPVASLPMYFHLHEKNSYLIPKLSKAFQKMNETGRTKQIFAEVVAKEFGN